MSAETVLTDEQIVAFYHEYRETAGISFGEVARAIEQAVLQSPEVKGLREDAENLRWLKEHGLVSFPKTRAWIAIRIVHPMPPNVMTLCAAIDAAKEKQS